MQRSALISSILLLMSASRIPAQDVSPSDNRDRILVIETCGEFQRYRSDNSDAAIRYAWNLASGYVKGLERGGIVDDLLPIPPGFADMPGMNPERERTGFVFGRFLIACASNPRQTMQEALNSAVADASEEFETMVRQKARFLAPWLRPPLGPRLRPLPEGCVPETGKGCDFIHLL